MKTLINPYKFSNALDYYAIGSRRNLRAPISTSQVPTQTSDGIAIVPATGWVFNNDKGEVTLIASSPSDTPQRLDYTPAGCSRH